MTDSLESAQHECRTVQNSRQPTPLQAVTGRAGYHMGYHSAWRRKASRCAPVGARKGQRKGGNW
jgi:hypothetical protein